MPTLQAQAAIMIDQASGRVLYAQNIDQKMYPASLTKLLSVQVALAQGIDLEQHIQVGDELTLVAKDASRMGLQRGDIISWSDLFWGMLLPSGNDAAYVVAVHAARLQHPEWTVSQAVAGFADLMNQYAASIGAVSSHFVCPDGYHDPEHYTTAGDLAKIARSALQDPLIAQVVGAKSHVITIQRRGRSVQRTLENTNQLLWSGDASYTVTGLKTGTTPQAGKCLVASASTDEMSLIAVVLDSTQNGRWSDTEALFDYGLTAFARTALHPPDETTARVKVVGRWPGIYAWAELQHDPVSAVIAKAAVDRVRVDLVWYSAQVDARDSTAIVEWSNRRAPLGKLVYTVDGEAVGEAPLLLADDTLHYRPSLWLLLALLVLLLAVPTVYRHRRQRAATRMHHS
jgi:D-alanyl-D-alanine carboxypeptidase (penicillin-binding protein 5/6)